MGRYGWRYDSDFTSVSYSFTNLDKVGTVEYQLCMWECIHSPHSQQPSPATRRVDVSRHSAAPPRAGLGSPLYEPFSMQSTH